jgi:hypothetical protein
MSIYWQRITPTLWRLDGTWTVVLEPGNQWRAYRGNSATLQGFADLGAAMNEAERLRAVEAMTEAESEGA